MVAGHPSLISAALTFCTSFDAVSTVIRAFRRRMLANKHPIYRGGDAVGGVLRRRGTALKLPW